MRTIIEPTRPEKVVTNQKRMPHRIKASRSGNALGRQNRSCADIAALVSHELKPPLTSAKSAPELLLDESIQAPTTADKRVQFLSQTIADVERLDLLLNAGVRELASAGALDAKGDIT